MTLDISQALSNYFEQLRMCHSSPRMSVAFKFSRLLCRVQSQTKIVFGVLARTFQHQDHGVVLKVVVRLQFFLPGQFRKLLQYAAFSSLGLILVLAFKRSNF